MGTRLLPGKGGFFHLNTETLAFFLDAIQEVDNYLNTGTELDLDTILDAGEAEDAFKNMKAAAAEGTIDWNYVKDNFGEKLYKAVEWKGGEYRVTVVLKNETLGIDTRYWFDPNGS
jgi:hypothetical protein